MLGAVVESHKYFSERKKTEGQIPKGRQREMREFLDILLGMDNYHLEVAILYIRSGGRQKENGLRETERQKQIHTERIMLLKIEFLCVFV